METHKEILPSVENLLEKPGTGVDVVTERVLESSAFTQLNHAKQRGDGSAIIELGMYYIEGRGGVQINVSVAKQYLAEFCSIPGAVGDKDKLVHAIAEFDRKFEILMNEAKSGNADSQHAVGLAYFNGTGGIKRNENLGLLYLKKAADSGIGMACYNYSRAIALSGGNVANTIPYLQKAINQELPDIKVRQIILEILRILPTEKSIVEIQNDRQILREIYNLLKGDSYFL